MNVQAHMICSENNYAPELLYYSDDEYKMIIMEYIDVAHLMETREARSRPIMIFINM